MSNETQEVAKTTPAAFDMIIKTYETDRLMGLQEFRKFLNLEPSKKWLEKSYDGKYLTIKIGELQQLLDMVYFGEWSDKNFRYEVIGNEVVGIVDLHLTHPLTGTVRQLIGTAAVVIMVDKGADPMDISKKKPKALETGFPKLSAMCLKNAARKIGKLFGRDINRDVSFDAPDVVSIQDETIDALINENMEVA